MGRDEILEFLSTRRRAVVSGAVAIVLVGFMALYFASPLMAFGALKDAAKSGDRDRLEQVVDFPAVRENLKAELSARMVKAATKEGDQNPFAALGALIAPAVTDRLVDTLVTSDSLSALLKNGTVPKLGQSPAKTDSSDSGHLRVSESYRTLNRFRVLLTREGEPDASGVALTMERRGLFGWKLIRIDLPEAIDQAATSTSSATSTGEDADRAAKIAAEEASSGAAETGSDMCTAIALAPVPAIEEPSSVLKTGETDEAVTQYRVDKKTGEASFCSHGGYCYPRYAKGTKTEILRLKNCKIGGPYDITFKDDDYDIYSIVVDRTKMSTADQKYTDTVNALGNLGLGGAAADNAAIYYLEKPGSKCAALVERALRGDAAAKNTLTGGDENTPPDYCLIRDPHAGA